MCIKKPARAWTTSFCNCEVKRKLNQVLYCWVKCLYDVFKEKDADRTFEWCNMESSMELLSFNDIFSIRFILPVAKKMFALKIQDKSVNRHDLMFHLMHQLFHFGKSMLCAKNAVFRRSWYGFEAVVNRSHVSCVKYFVWFSKCRCSSDFKQHFLLFFPFKMHNYVGVYIQFKDYIKYTSGLAAWLRPMKNVSHGKTCTNAIIYSTHRCTYYIVKPDGNCVDFLENFFTPCLWPSFLFLFQLPFILATTSIYCIVLFFPVLN